MIMSDEKFEIYGHSMSILISRPAVTVTRRPLSSIEDKLKISQKNVKLSVEVPYTEDISVQDIPRDATTPSALNNIQIDNRSHKLRVPDSRLSCPNDTTAALDSMKRPRELSMSRTPQIILELNRVEDEEGDDRKSTVSVRKLTWDFNEMVYKPDSHKNKEDNRSDYQKRRAISADCHYNRETSSCKPTRERPKTAAAIGSQCVVPLSFDQAAKTYPVRTATPADLIEHPDRNLNSTTPVIFLTPESSNEKGTQQKHYSQRHYVMQSESRTTKGLGGRKTPITSISFNEAESESLGQNEMLSYDEILMMRAPLTTSRVTIDGGSQLDETLKLKHSPNQEFRPTRQLQHRQHKTMNKKPQPANNDASKIHRDLRAEIKRQCTMPSYTVLKGMDESEKMNSEIKSEEKVTVVDRAGMNTKRNRPKIKPIYIPLSKRHGIKSAPTIPTANDQPERLGYLTFTLPAARMTKTKTSTMKRRGRDCVKSAPAVMRSRIRPVKNSYVVRPDEAYSDIDGVSGNKVNSPRQLQTNNKQQVDNARERAPTQTEKLVKGSSHVRIIEESGCHKLNINLPTVPHQPMSGSVLSSANGDNSEFYCSNSRQSIHSSQADECSIPADDLLQGGEGEDTARMKERIHQNLLQTLSDTEQFLRAMEQKRQNRKPHIVYSDDEQDLQEKKTEVPDLPLPTLTRDTIPAPGRKYSQIDDRGVVVMSDNHQRGDPDKFLDIVHNLEQRIQDGSDISSSPTQDDISESEFQQQPNNSHIDQTDK